MNQRQYPKIGLIYLTYPTVQWERDINAFMTSFEKINYPKDRIELICVESKSKVPSVKEWFERTWLPKSGKELPTIHYIYNDAWIGFAGNNNLGLKKAIELGCEYVHLTNEDTYVDPEYLLRAVERIEQDPKIAVVQSLLLLGEEPDRVNSAGNAFHYLGFGYSSGYRWTKDRAMQFFDEERKRNPELEISYASGAGELIRLSALDREELFDEKFYMYHEDTDLCLRLRLRGYKVVIEPRSIIWHFYEFGKNKNNFYYMERNRYALMFMYYRAWTLLLLAPMILVMELAMLLFSIKGGWFDMKAKAYRDMASGSFWRWIAARRRELRAVRTISDRDFLASAVSAIDFQEENVKNPLLSHIGNPLMRGYWWIVSKILV